MLNLTIKQLSEITRGELAFGSMPPLSGGLQEISRMIPAGEEVRDGDVVAFGGTLGLTPQGFSEAAFMQGAQGVISSRHVTPWDGGFAIRVPCVRTALTEVARRQRKRFAGLLVGVVEESEPLVVTDQLAARCNGGTGGTEGAKSSDLLWRLLQMDVKSSVDVLRLCLPNSCDHSIQVAAPDVIVVPPAEGNGQESRSVLDTVAIDVGLSMLSPVISERTTIVASREHEAWRRLAESRGAAVSLYDKQHEPPECFVDYVTEVVHQTLTRELETA